MSTPNPEGLLAFVRGLVQRLRPGQQRIVDRAIMADIQAPAPWTPAAWVLEGIPGSAYEFSHRPDPERGHTIFERRHAPTVDGLRTYVSADRADLFHQRPDGLFELRTERLLPPGTRIRFLQTLTQDACGDHPAFLMATKGQLGEIVAPHARSWQGDEWDYSVKADGWPASFCARRSEFEPLP